MVQAPNGKQQAEPMLEKTGALPEELGAAGSLLADRGYLMRRDVRLGIFEPQTMRARGRSRAAFMDASGFLHDPRLSRCHFRRSYSHATIMLLCFFANTRPKAAVSANVTETQMRCRLTLAVVAVCVGGSPVLAYAQTPIVNRAGGIAGTGFGAGAQDRGKHLPLMIGTGHIGAGTGGIGLGAGNATGGIFDATRAGTGGLHDTTAWGILTGGIHGSGRGLQAGTGGISDRVELGLDTGGIIGDGIGAGSGGLGDLNSLGAGTGGIKEQTAPRFRVQ
jgi:hypothetical protein